MLDVEYVRLTLKRALGQVLPEAQTLAGIVREGLHDMIDADASGDYECIDADKVAAMALCWDRERATDGFRVGVAAPAADAQVPNEAGHSAFTCGITSRMHCPCVRHPAAGVQM